MSEEMKPRVAKAIHKEMTAGRNWDAEAPTMKDFYLACAAAAIPAMRKPTQAMRELGRGAGWGGVIEGLDDAEEDRSERLYSAMIDEASK